MSRAELPASKSVAPYTRCSAFPSGKPCKALATVWMFGPDNESVPGGWMCAACGKRIAHEFLSKLGEVWPLVPIEGVS